MMLNRTQQAYKSLGNVAGKGIVAVLALLVALLLVPVTALAEEDATTSEAAVVYLNGASGDDNNEGTSAETAVATFDRAKELLGTSEGTINVTGTVTVAESDTWSLSDGQSLVRDESFTSGVLVEVTSGTLTLENITIDGKNISTIYSLVRVNGADAELVIEDGTLIQNNVNTNNSLTSYAAAVTVANGTITMNGGTITNNSGKWGGGIAVVATSSGANASLVQNGGTISNNSATNGGGIFVYGDSTKNATATLTMNGGSVIYNTATSNGGGIAVWTDAVAYIYAGDISYNTQESSSSATWGGGGIYVNGNSNSSSRQLGKLYLYNVEIAYNTSKNTFTGYRSWQGTIAVCNTGTLQIYVTDGSVIHDNSDCPRDIFLYTSSYSDADNFVLSPVMLGGYAYNWKTSKNVDPIDLDNYDYTRSSSHRFVTTVSADDGTVSGLDRVKTTINYNTANGLGAAIGVNGELYIGRDDGSVTLDITKAWDENVDESVIPDSIDVDVYATDSQGVTANIGSVTLTAADNWTKTITSLPKYDSYYDSETNTSGTYTYTVVEDLDGYLSIVQSEAVDDEDGNDDTESYAITVTNLAEAELSISKTVLGTATTDEFTFQVTLSYEDEGYTGTITAVSSDGTEPEIEFVDGVATVTLAADETLTLTVGKGMTYTVKEVGSDAFGVTYTVNDGDSQSGSSVEGTVDGTTAVAFTNDYETVTVSGAKTWDDEDDADGIRPVSITIRLYADGEEIDSVTVTEEDGWSWNFEGLAKRVDGKEIVYTISEDEVDGYEATVDGYDVTNTHTPASETVTPVDPTTPTQLPATGDTTDFALLGAVAGFGAAMLVAALLVRRRSDR